MVYRKWGRWDTEGRAAVDVAVAVAVDVNVNVAVDVDVDVGLAHQSQVSSEL